MNDRDALLTTIVTNPNDDTPRLVYADWLEEHGGEPELAEFIRVQIELASAIFRDRNGLVRCKWCMADLLGNPKITLEHHASDCRFPRLMQRERELSLLVDRVNRSAFSKLLDGDRPFVWQFQTTADVPYTVQPLDEPYAIRRIGYAATTFDENGVSVARTQFLMVYIVGQHTPVITIQMQTGTPQVWESEIQIVIPAGTAVQFRCGTNRRTVCQLNVQGEILPE